MGRCQSGQLELTVNQPSSDYGGSNPSRPTMPFKLIRIPKEDMFKEHKQEDNEDKKKKKRPTVVNFTRCREPWCYEKILITDAMDPDIELARHRHRKHDIPLPTWADYPDKSYKGKKRESH